MMTLSEFQQRTDQFVSATVLSPEVFIDRPNTGTIIDVRSPKEYAQGHIPGAVNIPLLDDEQREKVGICYKQKGNEAAMQLAFELVAPKMDELLQACAQHARNGIVRMHCWRGGQRSENMAWLLQRNGIRVYLLKDGYKGFRHLALNFFEQPFRLVVLGGMTGAGKTDVLKAMGGLNEQIVDLEGIAHHKGSAFGWLGEDKQPTSEQFENQLFWDMHTLDLTRRIWVEDESKNIGRVFVPKALYDQVANGHTIGLETSFEDRLVRLMESYTCYPKTEIIESIEKLHKRLGGDNVKKCVEFVQNNDYESAIRLVLHYYDKRYGYAMETKHPDVLWMKPTSNDPLKSAEEALQLANSKDW